MEGEKINWELIKEDDPLFYDLGQVIIKHYGDDVTTPRQIIGTLEVLKLLVYNDMRHFSKYLRLTK